MDLETILEVRQECTLDGMPVNISGYHPAHTHSHLGQFILANLHIFWEVGGNQRTWKKPNRHMENMRNSTQTLTQAQDRATDPRVVRWQRYPAAVPSIIYNNIMYCIFMLNKIYAKYFQTIIQMSNPNQFH